MKRVIAFLTAAIMIISLASCGKKGDAPTTLTETDNYSETEITQAPVAGSTAADITVESTTETSVDTSDVTASTALAADPSEWSKEEIIDFYKKAAEKSNSQAESTQVMVLNELIINDGDGVLGFFIKILEPAIASVIKNNAFEFDGITGGFASLEAADAKSIKAYKSGGYTVVEMTMKEQTDGIYADAYAGSVGHAITVLGDVSRAVEQFPQFKVDFENADIRVNYVNATVKVKINQNGIIEKGSWKYTCDPEIRHLDISGIMIDKADAKIDYIITVGGGF